MKHIALLLLILLPLTLTAQTLKPAHNTMQQASLQFHTASPTITPVSTSIGTFSRLDLASCGHTHAIGLPQLPVYRQHIEIPICDDIEVVAIPTDSTIITIPHPVIPAQPKRRKSDTTSAYRNISISEYQNIKPTNSPSVEIVPIGIARSRRLSRIEICPVAYDPKKQTLTIYNNINITLRYKGTDTNATLRLSRYDSPAYPAPSGIIALTTGKAAKSISRHAPIRYVIVSAPMFRGHLNPLVEWKRQQGYMTDIYYTDDPAVGQTIASIRAFLKQQYTAATHSNPAPDYVLLVGDIDQMPSFRTRITDNGITGGTAHVTDLYFFTWTDDDVPDCLYGRFSANNIDELTPQIEKTLYYEQYAFADPSYLSKAILVAGYDAKQTDDFAYNISDPAMDYVAARYITSANGFPTTYYYKNNTTIVPPGVTVTGSCQETSVATTLRSLYAQGFGWINYSAHGVERGWTAPQFNTTQVPAMNNHGKPSIMIGNCCLTNHFNTQTCFGEALLRKGDLSGAVAYIGAINSTFWDDDFFWSVGFRNSISPAMHQNDATYEAEHLGMYDRLFHIGGEPFDEHYTSMGSMIHAGNMAVDEDGLDDYTLYYWEIYCLMGDPSLMPWLGTAQPLSLNYAQPVSRESGVVVVSTAPHAYVALRSNIDGSLIDAAYADANGNAALSFLSATTDSVLLLSAICQGHIPAFGTVSLSNDANIRLGISNLQTFNVRAGQTANISFTLSNIGTDTLRYINYLLRADPAMLTPLHNDEYIDRLDPYTSISQEHVCPIAIASNLADGDIIPATLQFISDTIVTTIALQLHVQAPVLSVKNIATQGIIAAGETIDLYATIINRGHADASQFSCTIDQDYGLATILSGAQQVERLQQDSTITLHFTLLLDSLCQYLNNLPLTITANFVTHSVDLPLSLTFFADDFETSDFQTLLWQNDASFPWIISNSTARHGTHSARSPRNMPHQQASTLAISFVSHNHTDSITFDYRTATESDNDFFSVMLDTASILRTSGVATDWQTFSYPVDSGQHVLRFIYTKDHSRSVDSDCVWIDGLLLPDTLTARFTYLSDSICLGTDYAFFDTAIPTATAGTYTYSHRIADTTHLLRLAILPAPDVRIISSDTAALPGQSVILTATGATYYIWNTGDTTATITATPDTPTTYTVSGTRLGCTAHDSIRISTRPLSIATASTAYITIYPNPTHGLITIQAPQMQRLTLFDIYGHSLISTTTQSPTTTIDLTPLPQGIYLLRLQSTNSITSHRIIKQ